MGEFLSPDLGISKEAEKKLLDGVNLVSFDVWLTLIRSNPSFKPARAEVLADYLGYTDDMDEFNTHVRGVDVRLDKESDVTGIQYGFKDRIDEIARTLPSPVPMLSDGKLEALEENIAELMQAYPPLLLEDDLPDTLKNLKESGRKLALVSNTGFIDGRHMRVALTTRGIMEHIDYPIFSNEVGIAKPDPRIFEHLVTMSGVSPSEILHIGDNMKADYLGARQIGIQSRHLSTNDEIESEKVDSIKSLLYR